MNCSFNIRYKPRTTRSFTKSDLTVYDSADNTALNALTVYGKSEVVDGEIISAGEGWATVDLGTLTWSYTTVFIADLPYEPKIRGGSAFVSIYATDAEMSSAEMPDHSLQIIKTSNDNKIWIKDSTYNDATAFQTAMSGVLLCYELADPTQGNAIAIKTDNGSGTNGTMATFSTGTPLRGIPDTVRDVMTWDGSSGEVTKNCGKVRLADLTWHYDTTSSLNPFFWTDTTRFPSGNIKYRGSYSSTLYNLICSMYPIVKKNSVEFLSKTLTVDGSSNTVYQLQIKDTDYTTVADFVASLGDAELVYELATPTTEQLTSTENASIAGLRTFTPTTHAQNNAGVEMTVDYTIKVPTI